MNITNTDQYNKLNPRSASSRIPPPSRYNKKNGEDTIGIFFKEMARYPLLSKDEEIELAHCVKFLVAAEEKQRELKEELSREPTKVELAAAMELSSCKQLENLFYRGQVAKRKMIRSNLRLVVSIAKRYLNRGVPFLDLIQEGAIGLNRAAEKFDPEKGCRFSTYAYWWIRQGISRTIANDGRIIRLPIHIVEKLNKLKRAQRQMRQRLQRNPNEEELTLELEIDSTHLRQLFQLQYQSLSLNHRVGKGEDTELVDLLEDTQLVTPEEQMNEATMRQEIGEVLREVLTKREQDVISLRYGFATVKTFTLEEVGSMLNLSQERVRQIQTTAIRKLRRPQVARRLKSWLK